MPAQLTIKSSEILEGIIQRTANGHSDCIVKLAFFRENMANRFIDGNLLVVMDDNENLLFKGIIQEHSAVYAFDEYTVVVHASSATALMDMKALTHTYQNMTIEEITKLLAGEYGGKVIFNNPNSQMQEKISCVQYEDSDWDFIRRLVMSAGGRLWAEHTDFVPQIYIDEKKEADQRSVCISFREGRIVNYKDSVKENLMTGGIQQVLYQASRASYLDYPAPAGWTVMEHSTNSHGYGYLILKRNNNIIISFRGTDDPIDKVYDVVGTANAFSEQLFGNNIHLKPINYMYKKLFPHIFAQDELAIKTLNELLEKYPSANFYITGHSLGGHLAQESMLDKFKTGKSSRIKHVELFNALGTSRVAELYANRSALRNKMHHSVIKGDFVGEFLLPKGGTETVYPKMSDGTHSICYFHDLFSFKPKSSYYKKNPIRIIEEDKPIEKQFCCAGLYGVVLEANDQYMKVKFDADRKTVNAENACKLSAFSHYLNPSNGTGVYMPPDKGSRVLFHFPNVSMKTGMYFGTEQQPSAKRERIKR